MSDTPAVFSPATEVKIPERPILIDEADGPCPFCQEWANKKTDVGGGPRRCDSCGKDIPIYPAMGGAGYEGVMPHHYHIRPIHSGPTGRVAIRQELCKECYISHRATIYPSTRLGVYGKAYPTEEAIRNSLTLPANGQPPTPNK